MVNSKARKALRRYLAPYHICKVLPPTFAPLQVFHSKCWYLTMSVLVKWLNTKNRLESFWDTQRSVRSLDCWKQIQEKVVSKDVTFDENADWCAPVELYSGDSYLTSESTEVVIYPSNIDNKIDGSPVCTANQSGTEKHVDPAESDALPPSQQYSGALPDYLIAGSSTSATQAQDTSYSGTDSSLPSQHGSVRKPPRIAVENKHCCGTSKLGTARIGDSDIRPRKLKRKEQYILGLCHWSRAGRPPKEQNLDCSCKV